MPNRVTITQPAANIVEIVTENNVVHITENRLSLTVSSGSGGASSNFELGSDLVVTNTIGDAIAGSTTYSAGTNLETIIHDILAPYLEPVINSITPQAPQFPDIVEGENIIVQSGLDNRYIQGFTYDISNSTNLNSSTNVQVEYNYNLGTSLINVAVLWSTATNPISLTTGNHLTPANSALNTNGGSYTVTHSFGYLLDGTGSVQTLTKQTKIIYRHPVYVYGSANATFTSISDLTQNGSLVRTLLTANPNESTQTITFPCNSVTANTSNYTYLIIPSIFTATEIAAATSGLGVADYTDSFILYDNSGNGYDQTAGTATRNYNVYRSIQTGAFDDDIDLTITLTL